MKQHRSGIVLVAVLVALLVVMLISAAIVRGLVVQHRLARKQQQRVQAFWFAESAVQRAQAQLEADDKYKGETWSVTLNDAGTSLISQAVIRVETVDDAPGKRTIFIQARSPIDPIDGLLEEREIIVTIDGDEEAS
jgi:Tfp pilus assembly protein PilX